MGGSLAVSALVALLPLLVVFVLLGVVRTKAYVAALAGLGTAFLVAVLAYAMPAPLALLSATQGAVFGTFPIMWIVLAALWLYQLTVTSGRFEDLRRTFDIVARTRGSRPCSSPSASAACSRRSPASGPRSPSPRRCSSRSAWPRCGRPAPCCSRTPHRSRSVPIAIPITTAATLTGIPAGDIGADRRPAGAGARVRSSRCCFCSWWTASAACARSGRPRWSPGCRSRLAQFATSNFLSVELTDIVASLVGLGATVLFVRVWTPVGAREAHERLAAGRAQEPRRAGGGGRARVPARAAPARSRPHGVGRRAADRGRIWMALFPYLLVIVVFSVSKLVAAGQGLPRRDRPQGRRGPASTGTCSRRPARPITSTVYAFQWLSGPGVAAADLRRRRGPRLPGRARDGRRRPGSDAGQAQARDPHRGQRSRAGVRDELLRPDDHRSAPGSPARARSSRSCRPCSAGSAPRSPGRTRAPTRCSPSCRRRPAPRPASTRRCSSRRTPPAVSSAR